MAGYDPNRTRTRSSDPPDEGDAPIDALLNATGEHGAITVEPTPTPPEGVELSSLEHAVLPGGAEGAGRRNTEGTEIVVVDPSEVEGPDADAAADPNDPTPPEAPLPTPPGAGATTRRDDDVAIELPVRSDPVVPPADPPDERDWRLLAAGGAAAVGAAVGVAVLWWRRR